MEVRIEAHVYAYYEQNIPTYRIWVNDNLYTEREYWPNCSINYIEEQMIIEVQPGKHKITLEKVRPKNAEWVWIERVIIYAEGNTQDIGLDLTKQDRQVIEFTV